MTINTRPDIHEQVICANVFIRKDNKYLVLRRSSLKKYAPDVVHPFGGKVDLNENPYAAAVREVYEETGLKVNNLRLEAVLTEITPVADEPYNWLIFHFSADYESGELQTTEEGEAIMLTADELKAEKLFPSVAPIIDHITDRETGTVFATFEYDQEKKNIIKQTLDFCVV
jgi:8-oxo-dGTP pyrophosphatase MutT (NUDIX family)